jgi:protein FAM32A
MENSKKKPLKLKGNITPQNIITGMQKGKIFPLKKSFAQFSKEVDEDIKQKEKTKVKLPEKTEAQIVYDTIKKKRMLERIEKKLESSYKDKIDNFNKSLANLPDHFDIPRVGPG